MTIPKPCKRCGTTDRYSDGHCKHCRLEQGRSEESKAYQVRYYQSNKARMNALGKVWRDANPEKVKSLRDAWDKVNPGKSNARSIAWAKANPERSKATQDAWVKANPANIKASKAKYQAAHPEVGRAYSAAYHASHKEQDKARGAAYNRDNPEKINAHCAHRRASKFQATPGWANLEKIKEFFYTAKMIGMHTGIKHHVDHIVPLNSKLVCGLHCEANLQILEAAHNIRKGNRTWPDMP